MEQENKIDINELKSALESASKSVNIKEKELEEMETSNNSKFMKSIKGFVHHKKYENLKPYIEIITDNKAKINCLVLKGEQGLGKSSVIKSLMKEMGKEICYINSYSTPLSFYITLYHNRFKHIILDDVFGLFQDGKGISILRALTNTESVRYVKYDSTSDKLDVPSNFIFEGSITILTNEITEQMDRSLIDRAIYREIQFTLDEKLEFMDKIIKFNYELDDREIKEITEFIKANLRATIETFTFRTALKIAEFYKHHKEIWKELAREELKDDEELVFVEKIMKHPIETRNRLWIETTGRSIRTLQRRIKDLEDRTQKDKIRELLKDLDDKKTDSQKCKELKGGGENGNKGT